MIQRRAGVFGCQPQSDLRAAEMHVEPFRRGGSRSGSARPPTPTPNEPMSPLRARTALLVLAFASATAACSGDNPAASPNPPLTTCTAALPPLGPAPAASAPLRATPATLPPLGLGAVTERFTSELWVRGEWAYTGTWGRRDGNPGNALKVWNVAGSTPVLVDSVIISGASTIGDVQVSDDGRLLVVATEGARGSIVVFDLADPGKPREISRLASASTAPGVHTAEIARVGGRLLAFLSVDPSPPRLVVVDLSDPANPREILSQEMGSPIIHDVFVRDGILFTALWNGGTTVWDIGGGGCGTPEKPVQIANVATVGGKVHNLWWFHDPVTGVRRYLFVGEEGPGALGSSSSGDIHVVDLAAAGGPREVAYFTVAGAGTHNFSVDEPNGILYAAYYNGGVRALDIRGDLASCDATARSADGRCDLARMGREVGRGLQEGQPVHVWGVQRIGTHVYASDMLNGLWKLDASSLRR